MTSGTARIRPMDALRGLVIVLMTLDHVRGFFSPEGLSPTDLATTTPAFFSMRWVTHLCAPGFVLLMGIAAAIRHERDPSTTRHFLLTRGLWLIFLEATWVSFSWSWVPTQTYFGVLWALGGAMLVLAAAVRLPQVACLAIGAVGTVALAVLPPMTLPGILSPGSVSVFGHAIRISYPLAHWAAVALIGWGLAPHLIHAPSRRLVRWGLAAAVLGLGLRMGNLGDPRAWAVGDEPVATALELLHLSKYPPSLDFLLVMLGIDIALMGALIAARGRVGDWLVGLGRVPMFYYLLHIPLAHALGNLWAMGWYGRGRIPADTPLSMALILAATALVLGLLTPACFAWDRLKRRRRDLRWLQYL